MDVNVKIFLFAVLFPVVFLAIVTYKGSQEPIIGILEDVPPRYTGQPDTREIRAVFRKEGESWTAFPADCVNQECLKTAPSNFPAEVGWTVAFNGKALGRLKARTQEHFEFYADIGLENIIGPGPVPTVGRKSDEYGGFLGGAVYRPLVTISKPYFIDPEMLKRSITSPSTITAVRKRFRKQIPKASNCKNLNENVGRPWTYADSNIKITKSYSSKRNWSVVQAALEPYRCDGPPTDEFADQWFLVTSSNNIRLLGHVAGRRWRLRQ